MSSILKNRLISVILPAYNEEGNIPLLYDTLVSASSALEGDELEFIFVDDCSTDSTPRILEDLRARDKRVNIIRLARNCGSHAADAAGLHHCRGDAAVIMAADLQEKPDEIMPKIVKKWDEGYKVVWGIREKRKGEGVLTILFSNLYHFLANRLTNIKQPTMGIGAVLLDRVAIDAFKKLPEKNSSILMLIAWLGFPQGSITYTSRERHSGKSKWTLTKKIKLSFDSLVSFSYLPMRFMSLLGLACTAMGACYSLYIVINNLWHKVAVTGWSSLMIAILLIGGMQMMMLGVLGEYLWRTYDEARQRPLYVIEKNTLSQ